MVSAPGITQLLIEWRNGNPAALDQLIPLVYGELQLIAQSHLSCQGNGHTLQTADLVHEAYLRLVRQQETDWQDRAHFFAVAAQIMRHLLVDHARAKHRAKRGGDTIQLALKEEFVKQPGQNGEPAIDLLALDEALDRLGQHDARKCRIVELRYFGGLSVEETAEALGVSAITVKREWLKAKVWLVQFLNGGRDASG
jgi:RNA polymerase sigma factor (TIGR02999 family)